MIELLVALRASFLRFVQIVEPFVELLVEFIVDMMGFTDIRIAS